MLLDLFMFAYVACAFVSCMKVKDYVWIGGLEMDDNQAINETINMVVSFIPLVNIYTAYLTITDRR